MAGVTTCRSITLPFVPSNSTVTGITGAWNCVVRLDSGGAPTIVYGQTDCGWPKKSNPGVVNESDQFASESTPGNPEMAMDCRPPSPAFGGGMAPPRGLACLRNSAQTILSPSAVVEAPPD
jgi:hypothetical protein